MAHVGKIIAAFVGGALAGAAAALLLTPKSGAETRAEIVELARQKGLTLKKEEIEAFVNKVLAKLKDYFSDEELEAAVDEVISDKQE